MGPVGRSDDGATLVETLVAVSIVGIAFTALVGGMYSTMVASDVNRKQAKAATYLTSYAEAVKGDLYDDTCPATYTGSTFPTPAGYTTSNVVEYWDGTSTFVPACGADTGLQRITLSVSSADGRGSVAVQIVKRAP